MLESAASASPVSISGADPGCAGCRSREACLAAGLAGRELRKFQSLIQPGRVLQRGAPLIRAGAPADAIYVVRTGWAKSWMLGEGGHEQVIGLHSCGQVLGLDALTAASYPGHVSAMESTSVCRIPVSTLLALAQQSATIHYGLMAAMSQEVRRQERHALLLGRLNSEQKVANLIQDLAARFSCRGASRHEFWLHASREEMGNYLGIAEETVSRMLTRLHRAGVIAIENTRLLHILDVDCLHQLAEGVLDSVANRPQAQRASA